MGFRSHSRPLAGIIIAFAWSLSLVAARAAQPDVVPRPTPEKPIRYYADACQVDFSFLRPSGPHGFLRVSNGTFVWEDGTRARFWGVNISNRNLWIPHAEIDRVVDVIGRAGANLVRFEALDSHGGLLSVADTPGTRALDRDKLDTLQYWIFKLKQQHIAYYLDLLDFRDFSKEDGIDAPINRGARPYAMFDPHLIELQKEYATQLLTAVNPYTGLRPVDDPDLALLEICNEHGFFINPEQLASLVEPYRGRFRAMWNAWLLARYKRRDGLAAAWEASLGLDEDPSNGTAALQELNALHGQRLSDEVQFLYETQRAYFHTMVLHLRAIGLRIPVTAVVSNDIAPDLASVADECDFLSENFYADHPRFEGKEWEGKYHFRNLNQLRDGSAGGFAPYTAALRWENKPVVIREWGTVWPNRYRAASVPEAVAYAALQDFDGMLLFGFKTGDYADRLIFFGYEADPTVWGLFSLGAAMFLRGDIAAAASHINLIFTPGHLFSSAGGVTDLHRLAWIMRLNTEVRNDLPPPVDPSKPVQNIQKAMAAGALELNAAASPLPLMQVMAGLGFSEWSLQRMMQKGVYESCTGQIALDTRNGRLLVQTPNACLVAGELDGETPMVAGAISVVSASSIGAVIALSLDGRPLASSRHYIIKMVSQAENTGQRLVPLPPNAQGQPDNVLQEEGRSPVQTGGVASERSTRVTVDGRPVVAVGMENGTWELHVDDNHVTFACDTPNVEAVVLGHKIVTGRRAAGSDG